MYIALCAGDNTHTVSLTTMTHFDVTCWKSIFFKVHSPYLFMTNCCSSAIFDAYNYVDICLFDLFECDFWLAWKIWVYAMISVRLASHVIVRHGKNFNIVILLDTINVINVKLCMMVLIEFYLFIPLTVTLTIFQGHWSVR